MAAWDLKETYALVRKAFGREQEQEARASTQSVVTRQHYVRYHFREALRLQRAFERKYLTESLLLDLHAQDGLRKRAAFNLFIIKAGAHATAAIQSLHTIPDIFAHALYYSTGQQAKSHALPDRKIAVNTVVRVLAQESELGDLATGLRRANAGGPWRHLAAVANACKHRSLVRATLSEDWTGTRKNFRELHVSSLQADGEIYPAVSLQDLLEPEYTRLSELVVESGHALNAYLRRVAV